MELLATPHSDTTARGLGPNLVFISYRIDDGAVLDHENTVFKIAPCPATVGQIEQLNPRGLGNRARGWFADSGDGELPST